MKEHFEKRKRGEDSVYFNQQRNCWIAQYNTTVSGERVRKSATGKSEKEALQRLQLLKREIVKKGDLGKNCPLTFGNVMDKMMLAIHGTVQDKTYSDYQYRTSMLKKYPVARKRLDKLDRVYLQQTINQMAEDRNLCASTCGKMIAFIKRTFRFAVEERYLFFNPVSEMNSLKIPVFASEEENVLPLSSANLQKLLHALEGSPRIKPIVYCMLLAGLRISEVLALSWDRIGFDENVIYVYCAVKRYTAKDGGKKYEFRIGPPKTKLSVRTVPMSKKLQDCLLKWRDIQDICAKDKTGLGLVFPKRRGGLQDYDSFNIGFNKYLSKIGLDYHIYHSRVFRHTFASYAVKNGVQAKTLQMLMGHSNIETTLQYYVDVDMDSQTKAVEMVDAAVDGLGDAFVFTNIRVFPSAEEQAS